MAHAIWSGAINFGLVTIPVKLQTAVRTNDLRFNFLHKADEGRINNVRRCSLDGEDVSYDEIVRGYEYEKGRYVILDDEDFKRVNPEATQSVDIVQFVDLGEIDPMYFDKPYYLEPEKRGRHAYALLREALRSSGKVGIAKVVIRSREHIAALKPSGDALVLELMHFADEIVDASTLELPASEKPAENEMKVAQMLIDTMTEAFEPEKFRDTYREEVLAMIEARAAGKEPPSAEAPAPARDNVVNLMDVLQKSLDQSRHSRGESQPASHASRHDEADEKPKKQTRRKKSAA
ncbi:MAG: Ku protein [Candidatus Eremiobacteraeota bacterium]|nr:Ku protein [Candidatus Eremiobacteraeota bacterium]